MSDKVTHRGRIQAQGGGVETSQPWEQNTPLTRSQALDLMDRLEQSLKPKERAARELALQQARAFIEKAARAGGVTAPVSRSHPIYRKEKGDIRIDIEVITGSAFVPDPDT